MNQTSISFSRNQWFTASDTRLEGLGCRCCLRDRFESKECASLAFVSSGLNTANTLLHKDEHHRDSPLASAVEHCQVIRFRKSNTMHSNTAYRSFRCRRETKKQTAELDPVVRNDWLSTVPYPHITTFQPPRAAVININGTCSGRVQDLVSSCAICHFLDGVRSPPPILALQ